ncbi:hypothetical protein FPZ42_08075 [Mucilaginibacter achroorhodeus]|uniref:Uncharacterized protein n=1 Tax=Mucilaginibacter achroorhodeus TaxID=2599294 RepID=A0A563U6K7_9SPHI|nr:hypothetical protein [Mucilaginibacter achroorhodeus]TWR26982.1 hypothetical protein FPZ42_08075 [Mucilaginibacter achroorhodeus]
MLTQEIIYQNLSQGKFSEVIRLLYDHGNKLDEDPSIAHAISIFMEHFFQSVSGADQEKLEDLNHDLDILLIAHCQNKYHLKDDHLLKLIHMVYKRAPKAMLYEVAKDHPQDTICKEIIDSHKKSVDKASPFTARTESNEIALESLNVPGQKFETEIRSGDGKVWLKVFLRSGDLLDSIAKHLDKLPSVGLVNTTKAKNGKYNLTVYNQKPFAIEETKDEVNLTLENYFSRSPADPIFKEETISGISNVAYFQILDYMLQLGTGLEAYRSLATKMDEERYRDYFVNYLDAISNSHTATGETFHGSGKSDILIRNSNKEVLLVAECKLWGGKTHLTKALDQLFKRYVIWRDGKAALLIFNTTASGFTKIMETAVETVKSHPLYLKFEGQRKETSYSYTFRHFKDSDKTIKLELILFNFI